MNDEQMNRRTYLATGALATAVSVTGCSALSREIALGRHTEEWDHGNLHLIYDHDDEEILIVTFMQRPDTPSIRRLQVVLQQPRDTVLSTVEFRFKPDTAGDSVEPADIYFQPPDSPTDATDVYRESSWTVLEISEYGHRGEGPTGFHLLVHGDVYGDGDLPPIQIEHDIIVSGNGFFRNEYRARNQMTLDLKDPAMTTG